jgi:hypothetical protein
MKLRAMSGETTHPKSASEELWSTNPGMGNARESLQNGINREVATILDEQQGEGKWKSPK